MTAMSKTRTQTIKPLEPVKADPDLRARRFMGLALGLAQAANVLSSKPIIATVGVLALVACLLVRQPPRSWLWRAALMILTIAAGALVFEQYGRIFGRDPGVALLFMLGPLKLIEAKSTRDFMVVWSMALVLYVASFFENLGLIAACTVPPVIIVYVAALRLFDSPASASDPRGTLVNHLKGAAAHTLLGIPLAAMLFVLFPRATAPLWGMRDTGTGQSGLSEEMRPGNISQLILSKETAFRVEFAERRPATPALYWRGPVLREFDGVTWSVGADTPARMRGDFIGFTPEEHQREAIDYTVTLERQDSRWLPVLELPVAYPSGPAVEQTVYLTDAQQIGVRRSVTGATQYRAQSFARGSYSALEPSAESAELRTGPRQLNPRARAFAAALASDFPDPLARVQALLQHFNGQNFFYTLNPPLYGGDRGRTAIDEFFFDSRRGFCEHYAGATVFLLRASGIPARVVTGYQGGEYQPAGHMVVRQSDAHAWVEVWIAGLWRRVDPTAAVAPNRIELGLQQALPETERVLVNGRRWLSVSGLSNVWEQANFSYTKWVIGFDRDRQKALFKNLGLDGISVLTALGWMLLAITLSGAGMALAGWWWMRRKDRPVDPAIRAWRRAKGRLVKAGLTVATHETVSAVMQRAAVRWPSYAHIFLDFARQYNASQFATPKASDAASLPGFTLRSWPSARQLRQS
jgi:protein-glutamine gamma-glutamyltransferase